MANNRQHPVIILFDHAERAAISHSKQYLVVHGRDGTSHKISEKRQNLWELFNNAFPGEALIIVYETYNNIEYVADVRRLADELERRAVTDLAERVADKATLERVRSQAVSYTKDLAIGGIIQVSGDNFSPFFNFTDRIANFIMGVSDVKETTEAPETPQD